MSEYPMDANRLLLVGLNHKRARIEEREKLAVPQARLAEALGELHDRGLMGGTVLLSTCNRVECCASVSDPDKAAARLTDFFLKRAPGVDKALYTLQDAAAVRHIFRVTAGLDSMVLGEREIVSQVKKAYLEALDSGHTDGVVNKLFQRALYVGKAVRNKTGISAGISSCGGAAVALAERAFSEMESLTIMLVGAGKMAESAAHYLMTRKAKSFILANRSRDNAQRIADQLGGSVVSVEDGMRRIHEADVLIASTACPHYIVTRDRVAQVLKKRGGRPIVLIDLGVPRNIDPKVADVPGVHLYDIDDLEAVVEDSLAKRGEEIRAAETMVHGFSEDFAASLQARSRGPRTATRGSSPRPAGPGPGRTGSTRPSDA